MAQKKKKVTRIMKVTMDEDEFEKFDRGITHSDGGIRREDGKLSALPDIESLTEAETFYQPSYIEPSAEISPIEYGEQSEQKSDIAVIAETASEVVQLLEQVVRFLNDHPEVVEGIKKGWKKVKAFTVASYTKASTKVKGLLPERKRDNTNTDLQNDTVYEIEVFNENQERIEISAEAAEKLLEEMRRRAKELASMMFLWSNITIKDEKTDSEYVLEQACISQLLKEDVRKTVEALVANRQLLDESTAKTLSDYLEGYLTNGDRRIPIPVALEGQSSTSPKALYQQPD